MKRLLGRPGAVAPGRPSNLLLGVWLWVNTTNLRGFGHARDGQHIGSQAHVTGILVGFFSDGSKRAIHNHFELLSNLFNTPEETLEILHPLEVAYGDAASIRQDVRNDYNTLLEENFVRFRSSRTISGLGNNTGLDAISVSFRDDAFGCRWDQDITRNF